MLHKIIILITGEKASNFEDRAFLSISFLAGFFTVLVIFPVDLIQNYTFIHTILDISYIAFCFFFWIMGRYLKKYLKVLFLMITFLNIASIFFYNGGFSGGVPYYLCVIFLFSIILLRGYKRTLLIIFQVGVLVILSVIEITKREWIIQFSSDGDRLFDIISSLGIILLISSVLIRQLVANFDMERSSITDELESMSQKAVTDALTGIYNRHYLEEALDKFRGRYEYKPFNYSVIMCDLDHFKEINDSYGHAVGDVVLKKAAYEMQYNLRRTDILGRYGGEEFLFILPYTNKYQAHLLAEKIRKKIEKINFTEEGYPELHITASFGIASTYDNEDADASHYTNPLILVEKADTNLYRAKEEGRNRCV